MRNYLQAVLGISFLAGFVGATQFIDFSYQGMDHPLLTIKISLLAKILLLSYETSLLALILLPAVVVILAVLVPLMKFLHVRNVLRGSVFWLLALLIVMHFASHFSLSWLHSPLLSNLLLVPFYFLLPIMVFTKYLRARETKQTKQLVFFIAFAFIAICISANNTELIHPLTKEIIELIIIVLIVMGFLVVLNCNCLSKSAAQASEEICHLRTKNTVRLPNKLVALLILLTAATSIFGFFWENREMTIDHKDIVSKTKQDMNVILIVIDALRADHLGCYGYERNTSVHLDAFAREGVLFRNCYVQSSWTKPSTASLLTSLYPSMHGAISWGRALPDDVTTLAEIFDGEGYITYSYVANPNLKTIFNFNQGFDFFDDYLMRDKLYYAALRSIQDNLSFFRKLTGKTFCFTDRDNIKLANDRIIPWLERYKNENFFIYLHYMDPHDPYSPPQPYNRMYPYVKGDKYSRNISLYDGEIRFADENIGRLFEKLKTLGIYDKTLIIVTSDHGEAFGEHNDERHGHTVYQELLKVPLIMKYANKIPKAKIIEQQVRAIDVMPTILDVANIPSDANLEGSSLLPLLQSKKETAFCEYIYVELDYSGNVMQGLIKDNEWKYIFTENSSLRNVEEVGREELYSLIEDADELHNVIGQKPDISKLMRGKLDSYEKHCAETVVRPSQVKLDPETIQNLKSLGYLR